MRCTRGGGAWYTCGTWPAGRGLKLGGGYNVLSFLSRYFCCSINSQTGKARFLVCEYETCKGMLIVHNCEVYSSSDSFPTRLVAASVLWSKALTLWIECCYKWWRSIRGRLLWMHAEVSVVERHDFFEQGWMGLGLSPGCMYLKKKKVKPWFYTKNHVPYPNRFYYHW